MVWACRLTDISWLERNCDTPTKVAEVRAIPSSTTVRTVAIPRCRLTSCIAASLEVHQAGAAVDRHRLGIRGHVGRYRVPRLQAHQHCALPRHAQRLAGFIPAFQLDEACSERAGSKQTLALASGPARTANPADTGLRLQVFQPARRSDMQTGAAHRPVGQPPQQQPAPPLWCAAAAAE